jgi:hypothetical protein
MNNVNFKRLEVNAYTKQEAVEKVAGQFQIIKDATQAWKNANKPITEQALKAFCADYLQKHTKFASGIGCSITIESGTPDSRERPYSVRDIKNEKGKRHYKTGYQLLDKATGQVLGVSFDTKAKAKELAKKLYTDKGYKGDIYCKYIKEVTEGEVGAFEVTYTPSKSSKLGKYLCFGVEA